MDKFSRVVVITFILAVITLPGTAAAAAKSGLYVGSGLGVTFSSSIDMTGVPNDRASVCDEYINPSYATVTSVTGYEGYNCTGSNRGEGDDWTNSFGSDDGVLFGTTIGYRMPDLFFGTGFGFRGELEYFYSDFGYEETSDVHGAGGASGDKLVQEIRVATDRISDYTSHNLFANLFLDFTNDSRFTPYIGVGLGVGIADLEYGSVWARNPDARNISTGKGLPNEEEIKNNLAGSTSIAHTRLEDAMFGYQVLFGVDYAITETLSLGLKGRWAAFESFEDDGVVWDPLRSHVPNIRVDGSEPVSGGIDLDDIEMLGISMNLKYYF